jgi:hypothetical protein
MLGKLYGLVKIIGSILIIGFLYFVVYKKSIKDGLKPKFSIDNESIIFAKGEDLSHFAISSTIKLILTIYLAVISIHLFWGGVYDMITDTD